MCGHADKLINDIILVQSCALDALAAAVLNLVGGTRDALDISAFGKGDDDILHRNQILILHIRNRIDDFGHAGGVVLRLDGSEFLPQDGLNPVMVRKDILVVRNLDQKILVFILDLLPFQTGESPELHVEDRLCLDLCQAKAFHQSRHRFIGISGGADRMNDRIQVVDRNP